MNSTAKKILLTFAIIIAILFVFNYSPVFAVKLGIFDDIQAPIGSIGNIKEAIGKVFNIIITVSEIAFIIVLLVGGIMYLTTGGDETAAGKAKKLMVDAVIGIVIVLAAWAIGTWILSALKGTATDTTTNPIISQPKK